MSNSNWVRRLNCTVASQGELVYSDSAYSAMQESIRENPELATKDWYTPFFVYPEEEAIEHFEKNGNSMAGYSGTVVTTALYWDIDSEDLLQAMDDTCDLLDWLFKYDPAIEDSIQVYFSGSKGFHVVIPVAIEAGYTPAQTKALALKVAAEVIIEVDHKVYDPVRLMRMINTKHQKSGLYKIQLIVEDLYEQSVEFIKDLAKEPQPVTNAEIYDATKFVAEYGVATIEVDTYEVDEEEDYIKDLRKLKNSSGRRQCVTNIEEGYMPPGTSNASLSRLAANHKHEGKTLQESLELCKKAVELRGNHFPDANTVKDSEIEATVKNTYKNNKGGTYSCKTDDILINACSMCADNGNCIAKKSRYLGKAVQNVGMLINNYIDYSNELLDDFPSLGIKELDEHIRLRPKNVTILAGANGAGKTSVMLQMMESLNEQQIPHMVFSMDMADSSLFEKIAARYTDYSQREIESAFSPKSRDPEIIQHVAAVVNESMPYSMFNFNSAVDMDFIENTVKGYNSEQEDHHHRIQVVFIDYAGRLKSDKESEYSAASNNAKRSNDVAKSTNTHLFILSQIPREKGDQATPIRTSRAAKSAGDWEENATTVLTMWRPLSRPEHEGDDHYLAICIAKNRNGAGLERHFHWEGKTGVIRSMDKKEYVEYYNMCKAYQVSEPPRLDGLTGIDSGRRHQHRDNNDR